MSRHIAIIPARRDSVGFKFKNRKFFDETANFLDSSKLYDRVVVSTNDETIMEMARSRGYEVHKRSERLSKGDVSIKAVFEALKSEVDFLPDDVLWLFYLPILYKDLSHFVSAKHEVERRKLNSLMTFVTATTHPYTCWKMIDGGATQFIPNDVFRRQDMPQAWAHYHYACALRVSYLEDVNQELIGPETFPVLLSDGVKSRLVEIDTPEDFERWNKLNLT